MLNKNKFFDRLNEGEPPNKKLISDADILIKELSEKQLHTKTTLLEQLNIKKEFQNVTEFLSLNNFNAGTNTLHEFNLSAEHSEKLEQLKALGLTNDETNLYFDSQLGDDFLKNKYQRINHDVLLNKLDNMREKIRNNLTLLKNNKEGNRLNTELMLSTKPESVETKLLKFALENEPNKKEILPHPLDNLKLIEKKLFNERETINIKKIRKHARSLSRQISALDNPLPMNTLQTPRGNQNKSLAHTSKWDLKVAIPKILKSEKKYTCKEQNYYTIKDGKIIKLDSINSKSIVTTNNDPTSRLTIEEIKKIDKFKDYDPGLPTKLLYLKNLPNDLNKNDLVNIFQKFPFTSVKLMKKGKMRNQAFIEFEDVNTAKDALNEINGIILKEKPIIIQYGWEKIT